MDITELIAQLAAKDEQNNQLLTQVSILQAQLINLQAQLDNLLRLLYGKKSEKKIPIVEATSAALTKNNNALTQVPKNKPIRKKLPDDLPREDIKYELTESERLCSLCHNTCHKIGEEVSEQLEIIPAKLFVKRHIR